MGRRLPIRADALYDVNTEACFIGSCIVDGLALDEYHARFAPEHFCEPAHQVIWRAMLRLHAAGRRDVDGVQLLAELKRADELDSLNQADGEPGTEYLRRVVQTVPSAASVKYYADILSDRLVRRSLFEAAQTAVRAVDQGDDPREVLDRVESQFMAIRGLASLAGDPEANQKAMPDLVTQAFSSIVESMNGKRPPCVSLGLPSLDSKLDGGLRRGDMCIIAARPSVGKTSLALQMATYASATIPVAFVSLEMPPEQIALRVISATADVPASDLRRGTVTQEQFQRVASSSDKLRTARFWVVSAPSMSPLDVRAQVRRLSRKEPLGLVVIDYLQLMFLARKTENRNQEVSQISRLCKSLALELSVPLILVSQLNRGTENRVEHRPRLSDLRESGAIEQDGDEILMLHREDYYHMNDPAWSPNHEAEICVAKQRNGATGIVRCSFKADTMSFFEVPQW
jgi:replicative DNA helicase